jgi:hypothetical protein
MAEERNLATVRATDATDTEDVSKEELQRRMEEARESITQTVAEIKDTVASQYQAVRETVTDALDWREQFRRRPIAFSVGALSVGFLTGYCLAGVFKGDGESYSYDEDTDLSLQRTASASAPASSYYRSGEGTEGVRTATARSYAAQAITGSSSQGASDYDAGSSQAAGAGAYSPAVYGSSSSGAAAVAAQDSGAQETEEESGPGLIERFKGTKAYDRLEEEVSALGDRFIDELSKTAQTVVLPALFSKVKELFGVDLSGNEGASASSQQPKTGGSTATNAALSGGAQSSFAGVNRGTGGSEDESTQSGTTGGGQSATGGASGGTSYATSENRGYGATAGGGDYPRGSD